MRDRTKLALIGSLMALVACGGTDEGPYPLDPPTDPSTPAPSPSPGTVPPPFPVPSPGVEPTPTPPPIANRAPVANAGVDQTGTDGTTFQLDGSASTDPDGDPKTYVWSFVEKPNGSGATLTGADSEKPTFKADVIGTYKLRLEVSDGRGLSSTDELTVNVNGPAIAVTSSSIVGGKLPLAAVVTAIGGNDTSPALAIANAPTGTKFFAIVMDDETLPCLPATGACAHWSVLNLWPAKVNIAAGEDLSLLSGVVVGAAYNDVKGYQGPNPPAGPVHTYNITVYALGAATQAEPATPVQKYTRASFEAKYAKFILGKATVSGTYP